MNFSKAENRIQAALDAQGGSGLSVGLVQNGELAWYGGFGRKDMDDSRPPDKDTRYAAGSTTKAMTATCLGMLKEEGKVDWDAPVTEYLPEFQLYDGYATRHVTLGDMLAHNTGVPRHDGAWLGKDSTVDSTARLVEKIRYLPPNKPFRSRFEYNNFMYMAASLVVERVSGLPFGQFLHSRLFQPLGMLDSSVAFSHLARGENRARPYIRTEAGLSPIEYYNIEASAGAGAVNSTVSDMAKWVAFNLNKGALGGVRLLSVATMEEIHAPRVVERDMADLAFDENPLSCYGYGWFVQPYRGRRCIQHGGNVEGFSAYITMLNDEKTGVVVLMNQKWCYLPYAAAHILYDELLGAPETDWPARYAAANEKQRLKLVAEAESIRALADTQKKPSFPLAGYAGAYLHPGHGRAEVSMRGDGLVLCYQGSTFPLTHVNCNTFLYEAGDSYLQQAVTFAFCLGRNGAVSGARVDVEPAVKGGGLYFHKEGAENGT